MFTRIRSCVKATVIVNMGFDELTLELSETDSVLISRNCEVNGNSLRIFSEGCSIIEARFE